MISNKVQGVHDGKWRANTAYVALDQPDSEDHHRPPNDEEATGRSVLHGVLHHVGAELSAHETIEVEHDRGGIAQLAAEYETIATANRPTERDEDRLHLTSAQPG